jgi:hypothetical protein
MSQFDSGRSGFGEGETATSAVEGAAVNGQRWAASCLIRKLLSCAAAIYNDKWSGQFARFVRVEASLTQHPPHRCEARATVTAIAVAISFATVNSGLLIHASEGRAEELASAGYLSFFADEQDARILLERLNADPEIAFIVPDGPRMPPPPDQQMGITFCGSQDYWQRWRAARPVDGLKDGKQILWDISAGPLLASRGVGLEWWQIPDPWAGWTSQRPVCGPNVMPDATIQLHLWTRYAAYTEERTIIPPLISDWLSYWTIRYWISYWRKRDRLVASHFQWSGGSLQTARWAIGLDEWFSRNAVRLQARHSDQVFWAFPSALQRLKAGLLYDARGYDLDESIRQARLRSSDNLRSLGTEQHRP